MTNIEKIMLSHESDFVKSLSHRDQMAELRSDHKQYDLDWAPYYIECRHPEYDPNKPWLKCPRIYFAWRLPHARLIAYQQSKRTNRIVTIHDNNTDEIVK